MKERLQPTIEQKVRSERIASPIREVKQEKRTAEEKITAIRQLLAAFDTKREAPVTKPLSLPEQKPSILKRIWQRFLHWLDKKLEPEAPSEYVRAPENAPVYHNSGKPDSEQKPDAWEKAAELVAEAILGVIRFVAAACKALFKPKSSPAPSNL